MTAKEVERFKQMFSRYCRENTDCDEHECAFCCVNAAYEKIFHHSKCTKKTQVNGYKGVISAKFKSVWDDGMYVFTTDCLVDIDAYKVFSIEEYTDEDMENAEHLDREYIVLPDGQQFDVVPEDEMEDEYDGFYYCH